MGNIAHTKLYKNIRNQLDVLTYKKVIDVYNYSVDDFEQFLISELTLHLLVILENERNDNIQSAGVDISCRVIIETMALLKAASNGLLSDAQKKIFLLSYLAEDMENNLKKNINSELKDLLRKPYNKLISEYQTILDVDELKAKEISRDRIAFLKYGGEKRQFNSYNAIIKATLGGDAVKARENANVFIHPSYAGSGMVGTNEGIDSDRLKTINQVLTAASEYIPEFNPGKYVKSINNVEFLDEETVYAISKIKKLSKEALKLTRDEVWNNTIVAHERTRAIIFWCFKKMISIIIDLLICESLDYRTLTVAKSKSLIEMISMIGLIMKTNDVDDKAFSLVKSTMMALSIKNDYSFFEKIKNGQEEKLDKSKQNYQKYISFVRKWYEESVSSKEIDLSFDDFRVGVLNSQIYFLYFDSTLQFKEMVRSGLNQYLKDEKYKCSQLYFDYVWSLKVDHACTYKSEYRENKSFSLVPNLIDFFLSVFEKINHTDETEELSDYLKDYSNWYRNNTKNKMNEDFSKIYKK